MIKDIQRSTFEDVYIENRFKKIHIERSEWTS